MRAGIRPALEREARVRIVGGQLQRFRVLDDGTVVILAILRLSSVPNG
jgi:hypothetical protein